MTQKPKPVNAEAHKMFTKAFEENPLAFAVGKHIKASAGIPLEGELEKLGIEVADFRAPVRTDYYCETHLSGVNGLDILIVVAPSHNPSSASEVKVKVEPYILGGKRFILKNRSRKPTPEAFSIPKDMHKADGIPRDCDMAKWNAANLVCLYRPFSGGNCPLKCEGDKRSGQLGEILKFDCR